MATLIPPTPATQQPVKRPGLVWWKGTLIATSIVCVFVFWEFGSELYAGYRVAPIAVGHFHEEFNTAHYEQIWQEASPGFREGEDHDKLIRVLQLIRAKLGTATEAHLTDIHASVNTSGNSVTTRFDTTFTYGAAKETFVWIKKGSRLELLSYDVTSDALLN